VRNFAEALEPADGGGGGGDDNERAYLQLCAACGRAESGEEGGTLQQCAPCQLRYYCSREYQKRDWKHHKKMCQGPAK